MSKKQDAFYFDSFLSCADYACQAAHLLEKTMGNYQPQNIKQKLDEMHAVEHAADQRKHELLNVLAKAFITPIEREDIILLSQNIDEITDKIEDVLLRLYCNNIQAIRPDALKLVNVVIRCCDEVKTLLAENLQKMAYSECQQSLEQKHRIPIKGTLRHLFFSYIHKNRMENTFWGSKIKYSQLYRCFVR